MVIAKGRTDCEAERDTIVQGFNDLLKVLKQAKCRVDEHAKAALYDIINDKSLPDEERANQSKPFNDLLSEQEEADIRIRRTILIGIFSFWELSLKDICEYYNIDVAAAKGTKQKKVSNSKTTITKYSENDYLNAIFRNNRPEKVDLISTKIKELRNYMTHGSADKSRQKIINNLISAYPNFYITKTSNGYSITSYNGLENILMTINEELMHTEMTAKTLNVESF